MDIEDTARDLVGPLRTFLTAWEEMHGPAETAPKGNQLIPLKKHLTKLERLLLQSN